MPTPDPPPLQVADLLRILQRRRRLALGAGALAAIAVILLLGLLSPSLYRASATLSPSHGSRPVTFQADQREDQASDQLVNSQRELITAKEVLADALRMGDLLSNPRYSSASDPVALLTTRIRTEIAKGSWVITVTLDDEDPERARTGLQSVIDAFSANQANLARDQVAKDIAFVEQQRSQAGEKLMRAREAERLFREEHRLASADPDHNHITTRIQALAERQGMLDDRIAASSANLSQMQHADTLEDRQARLAAYLRIDTISTTTVVGALQKSLFESLGKEAELTAKYLDKHPRLIEVRSQIATLRAQLEESILSIRSAAETDHRSLIEQRESLVTAQGQLHKELNNYRENLVQLGRLTLESQAQQRVHDELVTRHAQITTMASYSDQRLSVSSPPSSSPLPRRLGTAAIATLALVAATFAGLLAAIGADSFDPAVRDGKDLHQATGLRILAVTPFAVGLQKLFESGPGEPPATTEAVRGLLTSLRVVGQPQPCQLVLLVSPAAGDGRSSLASRLAACGAMSGRRVLLVDADLRSPALHEHCGTAQEPGLTDLLAGTPDISPMPAGVANLDLLPAGQPPANPNELLNSHCLSEWLTSVRTHYDLIVLDSTALGTVSDAMLLCEHVDAVLLLARLGKTSRADLAVAWNILEPWRSRVVGAVLIDGG